MVHDEARVERGVFVRIVECDALEVLEDRPVHRAIEQAAAQLLDAQLLGDRRVRIVRPHAVVRPADDHRCSPRIRAQQPIDSGLLVLAKTLVTRHLAIEHRLRRERGHQIVRAPDKRDSDPKAILRAADNRLEAIAVILFHLPLDARP